MEIIEYKGKATDLIDLLMVGMRQSKMATIGLTEDLPDIVVDIQELIDQERAALFVAKDGGKVVGLIGIKETKLVTVEGTVAQQHLWLVDDDHRGLGARLFNTAKQWARQRGYSHIFTCANAMIGDYKRIKEFYRSIGADEFEASYMVRL